MNNQAIGIIDSGLGGIAAIRELNNTLPHENVLYLSDIANFPYEKENRDTVKDYICKSAEFLASKNVKLIINACDFIGALPLNEKLNGLSVIGMQLPAAQVACSSTKNGKIGIIGNAVAVRSGSISKAIKTIRPSTTVIGSISSLIVPAVIDGYHKKNSDLIKSILSECLLPILNDGADTIIFGSIYFEFVSDLIREITGNSITLISPIKEAVKVAELSLFEHDTFSDSSNNGCNTLYVHGNEEFFKENSIKLSNFKINGKIIGC